MYLSSSYLNLETNVETGFSSVQSLSDCIFSVVCVCLLIVSYSETPWPIARPALLSMGFPRQEYWTGLSLLSPLYGLYASKSLHRANQRIVTQIEYLNSTSKRLANEYYLYFFG